MIGILPLALTVDCMTSIVCKPIEDKWACKEGLRDGLGEFLRK